MSAHMRKAVGSLAILAFLLLYTGVALSVGDHVPKAWYVQLVYWAVVGIGWGLPVIPVMSWMNRGR
jgi:hypothetical protein